MMKVTLCVLLIAGLCGVLAGPVIKKRAGQQRYCFTSEGVFRHGQVFNTARSPCLKYRCEFGMAKVYEKGCRDASGRCRRPGERFPYHVNGRIYDDCTCTTTSTAISYSCNQPRRGTQ